MLRHHRLRRTRKPLLKRKILKLRRLENLQHRHLFRLAHILHIVRHVDGNDTDVTRCIVEGACGGGRGEDGDAGVAPDEVRPFVCVGVPVEFADRAGLDDDVGCGHGGREREIRCICDPDLASLSNLRFLREHFMRELEF